MPLAGALGARMTTATPLPARSTAWTWTRSRSATPSASSRRARPPVSSGSSFGRIGPMSRTVTARAEPPVRLRQLAADRPAADHDQVMRGAARLSKIVSLVW